MTKMTRAAYYYLTYLTILSVGLFVSPWASANIWQELWGSKAANAFYAGSWSYHLHKNDERNNNNKLLAITYRGVFAGTFDNSFNKRSYALGVQRTWYQKQWGDLELTAGYRLGGVSGYGNRYINLAGITPNAQLLLGTSYKNFGVEFSSIITLDVYSVGLFYKFG
jgi:hypothetical protein